MHAGLAGVRQHRFRHNDLAHLAELLERYGRAAPARLILVESVYSMDGDRADITALAALANEHDALLMVDEAHATGVLGPGGAGLCAGIEGVGVVMGTMPYMAPEQVQGHEVDARADLFAFGAILYEMLTGERAFAADSQAGLIAALLDHQPPPITAVIPSAPRSIERVATIADSLGAPYAAPITFELCRRNVEDVVLVSDDELREAMRLMLREIKLAVEPAGASAMAALVGPLREKLRGRRVGLIVCGSNIDAASYAKLIQ